MNTDELKCLTDNIYYEARGETVKGMLMVGKVTINRSNSGLYPNGLCNVVYQKNQFSWTNEKKRKKPNPEEYERIKQLAMASPDFQTDALFYHNQTVHPQWSKYKVIVGSEGQHTFYK
jgi:spore germination cell wall hydrolase CwlJ-like protein